MNEYLLSPSYSDFSSYTYDETTFIDTYSTSGDDSDERTLTFDYINCNKSFSSQANKKLVKQDYRNTDSDENRENTLKKYQASSQSFIPNKQAKNAKENLYSLKPKYFSTPIHFKNLQLNENKLHSEKGISIRTNHKYPPKQMMENSQRKTQIMEQPNSNHLKKENIYNHDSVVPKRAYPSNLSLKNQHFNYNSPVLFNNQSNNHLIHKNYQSNNHALQKDSINQNILLHQKQSQESHYNAFKIHQNYPLYYQAGYNTNPMDYAKYTSYTNWTNYMPANNFSEIFRQTLLGQITHGFVGQNRNFNSWFKF
jgi:hypothetical protein